MTSTTENPAAAMAPRSAAGPRSWYLQMRSRLGRSRANSATAGQREAISHPSHPIASLLSTIPSLRFATPARLRDLADVTRWEAVAAGDTIIQQGEDEDDVFFAVDGVYEVSISILGHAPDLVRELHAGDSFGELSVLYAVPRTATVRCVAAGHLLRIPGQTFLDTLETGS